MSGHPVAERFRHVSDEDLFEQLRESMRYLGQLKVQEENASASQTLIRQEITRRGYTCNPVSKDGGRHIHGLRIIRTTVVAEITMETPDEVARTRP